MSEIFQRFENPQEGSKVLFSFSLFILPIVHWVGTWKPTMWCSFFLQVICRGALDTATSLTIIGEVKEPPMCFFFLIQVLCESCKSASMYFRLLETNLVLSRFKSPRNSLLWSSVERARLIKWLATLSQIQSKDKDSSSSCFCYTFCLWGGGGDDIKKFQVLLFFLQVLLFLLQDLWNYCSGYSCRERCGFPKKGSSWEIRECYWFRQRR